LKRSTRLASRKKGETVLDLNPDQLLTTTRSVRKRLDFDRPVSRETIEECLEIALQAPNGSNLQTWHWLLVDDRDMIEKVARIYGAAMDDYVAQLGEAVGENYMGAAIPRSELINASVMYLRENFHRVPVVVLPLMRFRPEGQSLFLQASQFGSIMQAAWSFMLALRARGLGSAWTTVHLHREKEITELLDIPQAEYAQIGLLPVAYTIGTAFNKAYRTPGKQVSSWNRFRNHS